MIAEFVLLVSITAPIDNFEYKGHFLNCEQASWFVELNYPKATATRCILEEYTALPKTIEKRVIRVQNPCKINRSCDDR